MSKKNKLTREGVAQAEIGATEVSAAVKWPLLIAFLCTIAVVPLGQYVTEVRANLKAGQESPFVPKSLAAFSYADQDRDREELRLKQSGIGYGLALTGLYNGKTIENARKFETTLEEESWLLQALGPRVENVLIGMLGAGSRDVYCGRDGWLFFRPTIEYLTGRGFLEPEVLAGRAKAGAGSKEAVQPDPVKAIVDFRNQLARRGIELVVLPSPAKATIYPEPFSGRYAKVATPLHNPSFPEFLRRLEAQRVRVFDPAPLLLQGKSKQDMFLKTDTHWSPAGADLVARHLADYLAKNRLLPDQAPGGPSYLRVAAQVENAGDLAAMFKMSKTGSGYPKERVELQQVRQSDGTPWSASRSAEILFLGDSYANIFSLDGMGWGTGSGLVQQLSFHLQRPVDSILINDKGSFTTRQQLGNDLRRGEDRLAGKKVVIYEFATRELALGNWKLIDLPPVRPAAAQGDDAPGETAKAVAGEQQANGVVEIEGVIEEISQPPRPGSTAYKDAVIALHLTGVTAGGKAFKDRQLVIFTWGMRDNTITAASRYRRGQRVTLKVRPWSQVEQKYGSFQRIELQNDETVLLSLYWLAQPEDEQGAAPKRATAKEADAARATEAVDRKQAPEATAPKQQQLPDPGPTSTGNFTELFQKRLVVIQQSLEEKQARVHAGSDGWLFSKLEINHLLKGQFWGEAAQTASIATKPENRDPLPTILDFKQQLDGAGIELIVVPVPAKAHVYTDKLVQGMPQPTPARRFDPLHQQFLTLLEKSGVEAIDVTRLFLEARGGSGPAVFLQKDTHWSPYGLSLVAQAVKKKVEQRPWLRDLAKLKYLKTSETLKMKGDLAEEPETVKISRVAQVEDGKESAVASDRNSPILLLGDSHTLIFHSGGDMHAEGAGLPELLSYELGINVDLVGVRGSGATPARIELLRRRDNLKGKKLVIWCFTVREYTESTTGWQKLQVIRQPKAAIDR